ncbi:Chromatin organization modifier domain protein [Pyrenophora tritici-repentis]|nr:Chromatin organization modifier domain protein [Pyrenophora tritici-repentis]
MVRLARLTLQGQHDPYDDLVAADEMTTQEIVDALYPTDARLTAIRDALNNGHRRIPHHLIAEGVRLELGDLETNAEKAFMRYNRLLVPFSEKLRTRIIKDIHDSLPGGHGGRTTTYQQRRAADSLTNRIDATRRYLRDEIAWTQERMKDFADVHRHPAPRFAVGDWVLLNAKHIKTERPVKSLDHKNMGPYQITRVIDNMAYELDLPDSLKNIFPAFHPWLLQPYEDDALPGQPRANDAPRSPFER